MKVSFNVKGYIDRRTPELLDRYQLVEARRHAKSRWPVPVVGGVAEVDSGSAGAADSTPRPARIWPATAGAPFRVVQLR